MDEDFPHTDGWATEVVRSLSIARLVSNILFGGAVVAVLLGIAGAASTLGAYRGGGVFSGGGSYSGLEIGMALGNLTTALLPAGLLLAAAAALRIYAIRFETELIGTDDGRPNR